WDWRRSFGGGRWDWRISRAPRPGLAGGRGSAIHALEPAIRAGELVLERQRLRGRPDPVDRPHAHPLDDRPDERRALLVLPHFQVDAQDLADHLLASVTRGPPRVELRPYLLDRGDHGRAHGVHHVVAVAFDQGHH